jgi:hypothetical protein
VADLGGVVSNSLLSVPLNLLSRDARAPPCIELLSQALFVAVLLSVIIVTLSSSFTSGSLAWLESIGLDDDLAFM